MSSISDNQDPQLAETSDADLEFLRSVGLNPFSSLIIPMPTPEGNVDQLQGLTDAIRALARDVSSKMESLGERIEALESDPTANRRPLGPIDASTPALEVRTGSSPPEVRTGSSTPEVSIENTTSRRPRLWADRPAIEQPDYDEVVVFPEDEDDDLNSNSKLFSVSENTEKLLQDSFTKGVSNPARKQWRERYGDPKCVQTRIPKMDKMVRDRLRTDTAKTDRSLARLQALAMDAVGPLTSIVEKGEKGTLSLDGAIAAAKQGLKFLGNTAVQFSRERRKRAITDMNPKLTDLADMDSIYEKAAPQLFGDQFAAEAKNREDQLRCLDRASGRGRGQNFQYGRPPSFRRGGGYQAPRRGHNRGRGRFQPYQSNYKPRYPGKENLKGNGVAQ